MLRRLLTPRWLGALLLAAVFAVVCVQLGGWQWAKHEAKVERNERIDAHYRADPVPLAEVVPAASSGLPPEDDWTRVSVSGTYTSGPVFVRSRTNEGEAGLEVLWALSPDDGGPSLVVDRGWVAASEGGASVLPEVAPAPGGPVDVVGWVRRGEASRGRDLPRGQLASLNLEEAGRELGTEVRPAYLLLESERLPDGTVPPRPQPLAEPDRGLGPHLAYAFQWWLTTVVGFGLVWFAVRRELRAEQPERYPVRAKKVRIWDEEDA